MARLDVTSSFYGGKGFSIYHASGSRSRVPQSPHFHDEYLISAQLRGIEHCHVAGKAHEFAEGDLVLINPHQVHTGNTHGDDVEYVSLYVDRDYVGRLLEEMQAPVVAPEFTVVRSGEEREQVQELSRLLSLVREAPPMRRICKPADDEDAAAPAPSDPHTLEIEAALHRVVVQTFERFSNLRQPQVRSTNRIPHHKIARVLDYMRELPPNATDVTLEQLAQVAGLSKFHFLRQFDQVVGMTPGAYLRTLRLCHAARLLRAKDDPILEIALAVGFADHPSFSRAFARYMGMTPSQYRRLGPL